MLEYDKMESPDFQSDELNIGIEVTEAICLKSGTDRIMLYYDSNATIDEFNMSLNHIRNRIRVKTEKLNKLYKKYNENWLYIFSHNALIGVSDIINIIDDFEYKSERDYNKIFIDCIDKLYLIEGFSKIYIIKIPLKIRNKIVGILKTENL